jgi:SAM-dependent methyltransferase
MKQTPMHHEHNPQILNLMPKDLKRVVEVGCSSGALGKAYRAINPGCHYTGLEIDPEFAEVARASCSEVICGNIEQFSDEQFGSLFPSDCFIFGDVLEHLYDPWSLLARIKPRLTPGGCIIACVPNAQHWSIQINLNGGYFRYEDAGLMDRTHIRWFTRNSLIELFQTAGYRIVEGQARVFNEPNRDRFLPAIRAMATAIGANPDQAVNDAVAFQWVMKVTPV